MSNVEIEVISNIPPKSLFKYFSPDRFCNIFCERMIRFNQPSALNDPFELTASFETSHDITTDHINQKLAEHPDAKSMRSEFEQVLRKSGNRELIKNEIYTRILNEIGIFCFCEESENLLMWAHYAQDHKGFVVEFDTEHEFFSHDFWSSKIKQIKDRPEEYEYCGHLKKVNYAQERAKFTITNENMLKDYLPNFVRKSEEWKYEKEWRMFMPIEFGEKKAKKTGEEQEEQPDIYLFLLELSAIKRIILGCNADETLEKKARALKDREETKHILVEKAEVDLDEFKLNFKTLKS